MTKYEQLPFDDVPLDRRNLSSDAPRCPLCPRPRRWIQVRQEWGLYCGGHSCGSPERLCRYVDCGKLFAITAGDAGKYCSAACRKAELARRQLAAGVGVPRREWPAQDRPKEAPAWQVFVPGVPKTIGRNGRRWNKIRALVLHLSGVCWLCGHDGADSVDHVIPRALCITAERYDLIESLDNLRPAHYAPCPTCAVMCNRERGEADSQARLTLIVAALDLRGRSRDEQVADIVQRYEVATGPHARAASRPASRTHSQPFDTAR